MSATQSTTYIPQQTTVTTASLPATLSGQPHVIQVPVPAPQPPQIIYVQAPPQPQQPIIQQQAPPPQPQQPAQPIHIEINNTTAAPAAASPPLTINNNTEAAAVPQPQRQ